MTRMPRAIKTCISLQWISLRHVRHNGVARGNKPCKYRRKEWMTMQNEKALGVFMSKIAEAQERLAKLTAFVDEHMHKNSDEISWGSAGDAGYMVEN